MSTAEQPAQFQFVVGDPDTFGRVDHLTCRARIRDNGTPRVCGVQVAMPGDGSLPTLCPVCRNPLPWFGSETG